MNTDNIRIGTPCPICGDGCLVAHADTQEVEYGGKTRVISYQFSVCDMCGSEVADATDAKANKRAMNAFKKEVDNLLPGSAIREFRQRFDLRQDVCADLFGGGSVGFSRYENDDVIQSLSMDRLLRLCMTTPTNMFKLARISGVELSDNTKNTIRADFEARFDEIAKRAQEQIDRSTAHRQQRQCANDGSLPSPDVLGQIVELSVWRDRKAA